MNTIIKSLALVCAVAGVPTYVAAFDAQDDVSPADSSLQLSDNCTLSRSVNAEGRSAFVRLTRSIPNGSIVHEAGGSSWVGGGTVSSQAITAAAIEACFDPILELSVTDLVQNGPDNGSFAQDNYIGFRFSLTGRGSSAIGEGPFEFSVGRGAIDNNFVNTPPTILSLTGGGQVASGAAVTLEVLGLEADANQPLQYSWRVVSGDAGALVQEALTITTNEWAFTAPNLAVNAPDNAIVIEATVSDGIDAVKQQVTVTVVSEKDTTPPYAPSAANVTLERISETRVRVSGFGEPGGFVRLASDDGAFWVGLEQDGSYSVDLNLLPTDDTVDVTYSVGFENQSATVSFAIPAFGPTVAETQTEIATFMQSRANALVSAQPDLIGFLSGTASGAANLQATQGNGSFDFATSGDRNVWARLQGSWSEYDGSDTSYVFGVAGAHTRVGTDTLLGLMVQFDQAKQTRGDATTEGTGYLAGPYLVSKMPDQPLYFEARLLLGKTDNDVNVDGTTPETFETTRVLASAKVAGNLEYGALTLTPSLTATHLSETQEAFTDSANNDIPEQAITMTDVAVGLDAARVVMLDGGALTLTGGLAVVFSSTSGSGFAADVVPAFEGERGRVHLGASYALDNGLILSAGTSFDGLGSDGFESTSVNFGLQMQF